MIIRLARAEVESSGQPEPFHDLMICSHTELLAQLDPELVKEYYIAVFGEEEYINTGENN